MDQEVKDDIKAIRSDVTEIKVTLAVNTESLVQHVKRTDLAERRLEKLEQLLIGLAVAAVLGGIIKLSTG
jgi:hypothetical protein